LNNFVAITERNSEMLKKRLTKQHLIWFIQLLLCLLVFWMGYTAIGSLPEFAARIAAITALVCGLIASASIEVIE
jgi:hypothetical protein